MLAEDDGGRRQLRDLVARGRADGATLRLAEAVAAGAALGPVLDELVERRDRRQMTSASRMAGLGTASAPRGSSLAAPERRQAAPSGRGRGAQPGHPGRGRHLAPITVLDEFVEHWPERCACGHRFSETERRPVGTPATWWRAG